MAEAQVRTSHTFTTYQCYSSLSANWSWPGNAMGWRLETDQYLEFYNSWRGNPAAHTFGNNFPPKFSLGEHSPLFGTLRENILVTESYDKMFHRLLLLRRTPVPSTEGVVITGQPGIGASTRLDRFLVRQLTYASVLQGKPSS